VTEEELRKAYFEWRRNASQNFHPSADMQNAPKPSLEARLDWLEADASAQRTAILKLEKISTLLFKSVCALGVMCAALAVAVLT